MFSENKNVAQHSIDDVYETHKWNKTRVATLERNCLAHDTDSIKASSSEQNGIIDGTKVENVQRSACKSKCSRQVGRRDKNAEKTVVEEDDGVGHVLERSIKHTDWWAHKAGN